MIASQLAYGRRVVWRGLRAEIVEIRWQQRGGVLVQVRVAAGQTHWATPAELSEVAS